MVESAATFARYTCTPMEMTLGLLADAANTTPNRKLNILGVFSNITVRAFPSAHAMMNLVMRFSVDAVETGQEKQIEVRLVDPDGTEVARLEAEIVVPAPPTNGAMPDIQAIIPLPNIPFRRAVPHAFVVMVNGDPKGRVPLMILVQPAAEAELPEGNVS